MVNKKHLTVIRPAKVHSTYSYDRTAMFLEIHVLRKSLEPYLPDIAKGHSHIFFEKAAKILSA